jgi:Domain of unknown function (DUF222)/HNH endonuclease
MRPPILPLRATLALALGCAALLCHAERASAEATLVVRWFTYDTNMCSHTSSASGCLRPLEVIEREITQLASHIHAATCRWLGLVAEFDRREGWAQWGCRSCAHWISWQCSIAPVAAREHVRVARRLEELPLIRAAFARGELSYSKVRALSRVEGVEREEELLGLARDATAAQLERIVRAYRGVVAAERVAAGGAPDRYVSWTEDDDGSLLLRARLPAEEGALVLAALEAAAERLAEADAAQPPVQPSAQPAAQPIEALIEEEGAEEGASAEAPSMSDRRADALVLMADTLLASGPAQRTADRFQVVVHVDAETLSGDAAGGGRCETEAGAPLAVETARRLACDAAIVPLLEASGQPLSVGRKTRAIPPAMRRALSSRDRGCRFPGCGERRFVDAHHVRHWAHGGETSVDNLVQLCRHHHRLVHEGGYAVEGDPRGALIFRRPDGRRVPEVPASPPGCPHEVMRQHRRRGLAIAADACVPRWAGERLDLPAAVDAVVAFAPLAEEFGP